jgi:hypothetical protein
MLAHPTAPHRPSTPVGSTTPLSPRRTPARCSLDLGAAHRYALRAVRELRRTLDATFDPHTVRAHTVPFLAITTAAATSSDASTQSSRLSHLPGRVMPLAVVRSRPAQRRLGCPFGAGHPRDQRRQRPPRPRSPSLAEDDGMIRSPNADTMSTTTATSPLPLSLARPGAGSRRRRQQHGHPIDAVTGATQGPCLRPCRSWPPSSTRAPGFRCLAAARPAPTRHDLSNRYVRRADRSSGGAADRPAARGLSSPRWSPRWR